MTKARSNATAEAAKGDLRAGTGTNLSGILAVGNNGESLVADSTTTTGLRWQANTAAGRNAVLNSNFSVWQRGTSSAVTSSSLSFLLADRWKVYRAATGSTVSRQVTGDTTNLPFIQYCQRIARDSGNTATNVISTWQNFESVNAIPLAGKTVVLSFYARAGANYSAASSALAVQLITGTGTDQDAATGYTGATNAISQTATLTTTWQRFTYSATLASTVTELAPYFTFTPVGTAGANDYYEITGVQLEQGSVANTYQPNGATYQAELAACQRYYVRFANGSVYSAYGYGISSTTAIAYPLIALPTAMRIAPTTLDYSTLQLADTVNAGSALTNLTVQHSNPQQAILEATVAPGITQYRTYQLRNANSTSGYLGLSAEL